MLGGGYFGPPITNPALSWIALVALYIDLEH